VPLEQLDRKFLVLTKKPINNLRATQFYGIFEISASTDTFSNRPVGPASTVSMKK